MKYFFFFLMILLISCNIKQHDTGNALVFPSSAKEETVRSGYKKEMAPVEFVRYIQNPANGFKKNHKVDDITFSAFYKPIDYIISTEERTSDITTTVAQQKRKELNGMQYLSIKIQADNIQRELLKHALTSAGEYEKRINYCSFEMQRDFVLIEGEDTLPCSLFHFERAFNAVPYATFSLAFPADEKNKKVDRTLVYQDNLFNKGTVEFLFKKDDLAYTPKLKTMNEAKE